MHFVALTGSLAAALAVALPSPYMKPLTMAILGLSITAIAVIGARASRRSTDTMMYMVLASLAVTAVMVAYADKVESDYRREYFEQFRRPPVTGGVDGPAADGK